MCRKNRLPVGKSGEIILPRLKPSLVTQEQHSFVLPVKEDGLVLVDILLWTHLVRKTLSLRTLLKLLYSMPLVYPELTFAIKGQSRDCITKNCASVKMNTVVFGVCLV